jgi:hypothetical protein
LLIFGKHQAEYFSLHILNALPRLIPLRKSQLARMRYRGVEVAREPNDGKKSDGFCPTGKSVALNILGTADINHAGASLGEEARLNACLTLLLVLSRISANNITQQELRAELSLFQEDCMRTLLVGALVLNLAGCSHQPPPVQTAADSCASRNRLACLLSVRVSLRPASRTTTSATLGSKPAIARKAREAAVSLARTAD